MQSKTFDLPDRSTAAALANTSAVWYSPVLICCSSCSFIMWLLAKTECTLLKHAVQSPYCRWVHGASLIIYLDCYIFQQFHPGSSSWSLCVLTCRGYATPVWKKGLTTKAAFLFYPENLHHVLLVYPSRPCCLQSLGTANSCSVENTIGAPDVDSATAKQSKARREDATGGRSDAILTSNWKSSPSLFPIKRLCQVWESTGRMWREMKGETQRGGRQTGIVRWWKNGNRIESSGSLRKWKEMGEEEKTQANHPAVRGECFRKLCADAGLLGVFIDLQDFKSSVLAKAPSTGLLANLMQAL